MTTSTCATVPSSIADVQQLVRSSNTVVIHGAQTKPALIQPTAGSTVLDTTGLTGIRDYLPEEYTFTAMAGTPLTEVTTALAGNGQYLPFDPPFVKQGATVGGTVAAGLSGARRYRYGGVRDFIVGLKFVDGTGQVVQGGGKVVKNAAGFDFPKLFVGSVGTLGVIVEASFKVFPDPPAAATLCIDCTDRQAGVEMLSRLNRSAFDIDALDMVAGEAAKFAIWVRLAGLESSLDARCQRLIEYADRGRRTGAEEATTFWQNAQEFAWTAHDSALVKVPIMAKQIIELDPLLQRAGAKRRYSVGGNVAWIAWPDALNTLDECLLRLHLSGMVLHARQSNRFIGKPQSAAFATRIKQALDPDHRFPDL